jgi:biotin carboxylase
LLYLFIKDKDLEKDKKFFMHESLIFSHDKEEKMNIFQINKKIKKNPSKNMKKGISKSEKVRSAQKNNLKDPFPKKVVMILGASIDQVPMIKTAKLANLKVITVDSDKDAPGVFISDEHHQIEVMEADRILQIAKEKKIDGITTMVSNLGMRTVAYVSEKMGLPSISVKAAQIATDKKFIKEYLKKEKVPVPDGFIVSTIDEALELVHRIGFPVIVKPVDGTKGRGISVATSDEALKNSMVRAMKFSMSGQILVEEWVEGPTVGAECLIIDGKLIPIILTDKYNTPSPKCVTLALTAPSNFPEPIKERINDTAKEVAKVLGLNTGAAHIDMIVAKDGVPKVIDVGPRLASGPVIFDFVPKLFGVDMIASVLKMALGEKPELNLKWNGQFAASRFLTSPKKGCMYRIEIPKHPKDFTFYQYKELGEIVGPPNSDMDRIGCITMKDYSYEQTLKNADSLLKTIKVDVIY